MLEPVLQTFPISIMPHKLPLIVLSDQLVIIWEASKKGISYREEKTVVYRSFTPDRAQRVVKNKNWSDNLSLTDGNYLTSSLTKELYDEYRKVFPEKMKVIQPKSKPWGQRKSNSSWLNLMIFMRGLY